jgi:predicted Rossmann-fold nucleotide-binding protein
MNDELHEPRYPSHAQEARVDAVVSPEGNLEVLSQAEVDELCGRSDGELYEMFRRCSLAVLNCGAYVDDARSVYETYSDFDIHLIRSRHGIRLEIRNAPSHAFVDGVMIRGIREHLFTVLRDILYITNEIERSGRFDLGSSAGLTDAVFNILRNAGVLRLRPDRGLVVCWGGHAVTREEYDYSKVVGYELGLRGLDVCTGCGPGAMKGPMKGAAVGHAKQRIPDGRYIGISEPGIIAAESPNPIVNELVIMPDMEKRLEAFLRVGHGIIVFPGGVGTAEEILYLLGALLHPENASIPFPVILTGPRSAAPWFDRMLEFVDATLGARATGFMRVIVGDPIAVARALGPAVHEVLRHRREMNDAAFFNWLLRLDLPWQQPFSPTHENVARLELSLDQSPAERALNLRRIFTAIVSGNVKDEGIRAVEREGPFEIRGAPALMAALDRLLAAFITARRMKFSAAAYRPCYRLVG